MIIYDLGEYQLSFIFRLDGSLLPKAFAFALPSVGICLALRYYLNVIDIDPQSMGPGSSLIWSITFFVLSSLIGFRTSKAYARFWDGCTQLQSMSAEWFESCSNLVAFSVMALKRYPGDSTRASRVELFRFKLVHLMSLLHGVALRQIGGDDGEELEVLDIFGLDDRALDYLKNVCSVLEINRVEVILHWIQVLITESIDDGVLIVPPPILTRAYQTLSRGMVNLHSVRRIADIPFPFPLTQALIVLLLIHSVLTPVVVAFFFQTYFWCGLVTFLPLMGMWALVFICGQLEQPFGTDANDLPLSMQQFDFNNSLMMLVDGISNEVPLLKDDAAVTLDALRALFGQEDGTEVLFQDDTTEGTHREALKDAKAGRRASVVSSVDRGSSMALLRGRSANFAGSPDTVSNLSRQSSALNDLGNKPGQLQPLGLSGQTVLRRGVSGSSWASFASKGSKAKFVERQHSTVSAACNAERANAAATAVSTTAAQLQASAGRPLDDANVAVDERNGLSGGNRGGGGTERTAGARFGRPPEPGWGPSPAEARRVAAKDDDLEGGGEFAEVVVPPKFEEGAVESMHAPSQMPEIHRIGATAAATPSVALPEAMPRALPAAPRDAIQEFDTKSLSTVDLKLEDINGEISFSAEVEEPQSWPMAPPILQRRAEPGDSVPTNAAPPPPPPRQRDRAAQAAPEPFANATMAELLPLPTVLESDELPLGVPQAGDARVSLSPKLPWSNQGPLGFHPGPTDAGAVAEARQEGVGPRRLAEGSIIAPHPPTS